MLDRTVAPPFNRSISFDLIKPLIVHTSGGGVLHFVVGGTQEVCKVELLFPAGRWYERTAGASYFTAQLLNKGTEQKDSFVIAELFDQYGAHLEISPGVDVVSVALYSLNKFLEPSLQLLMELLTSSVFPEKELAQAKTIHLQNMKVNREKTSYLATVQIRKNIFGEDHPYGHELADADVLQLQSTTLSDHYRQHFANAIALVSGNISAAQQQMVVDMLSPLKPFNGAVPAQAGTPEFRAGRQLMDKAGSVQASIRMGKKIIGRDHEDYADLLFLNHIFGGYFGSRLMKNIREEKGLSYGISSSLHTMAMDSYLVIGADVNSAQVGLTFDEIGKELAELGSEPVGTEELETARNHFIGSLQLEITTSFDHAEKNKNLLIYSLPDDFYQRLVLRIDQIGPEDLMRTANRYFVPGSFVEVGVG
jgi:predicted Zn-dependent peptidase